VGFSRRNETGRFSLLLSVLPRKPQYHPLFAEKYIWIWADYVLHWGPNVASMALSFAIKRNRPVQIQNKWKHSIRRSLAMIWHWREMTHILGCVVLVDITQFSLVDQWLCDHLVPKAQNHWEMRSPCAITSKTHVSIWMHQQRCRIADGSDLKGDDDSWKIHRKCCHCYSVQLDGRNDRYTFEIRCCLDLSSLEEDREQTAHNYIIFKRHSPHLYNKGPFGTASWAASQLQ
jgi:hypothetical protein